MHAGGARDYAVHYPIPLTKQLARSPRSSARTHNMTRLRPRILHPRKPPRNPRHSNTTTRSPGTRHSLQEKHDQHNRGKIKHSIARKNSFNTHKDTIVARRVNVARYDMMWCGWVRKEGLRSGAIWLAHKIVANEKFIFINTGMSGVVKGNI